MHCEPPRKEGVYRIHCFPKLFGHGTLSFFIEYFMGLVFCKKSQQMLPLVVANCVFPVSSSHLSFSLPLFSFAIVRLLSSFEPAFPSHLVILPPIFLCLFPSFCSFFSPFPFQTPLSPPLPPFLFAVLTHSSCSSWLFKKPESFLPLDDPGKCPA